MKIDGYTRHGGRPDKLRSTWSAWTILGVARSSRLSPVPLASQGHRIAGIAGLVRNVLNRWIVNHLNWRIAWLVHFQYCIISDLSKSQNCYSCKITWFFLESRVASSLAHFAWIKELLELLQFGIAMSLELQNCRFSDSLHCRIASSPLCRNGNCRLVALRGIGNHRMDTISFLQNWWNCSL